MARDFIFMDESGKADSRYVEMLQVADWISGSIKEKLFTHPERDFDDLFQYIRVKEITG